MKCILSSLLYIAPFVLSAQMPLWIWPDRAEKTETVYFRKVVELPAGKIKSAKLQATCDNGFSLFVNGKPALAGDNWNNNYGADIAKLFTVGPNVVYVDPLCWNHAGGLDFIALPSPGYHWHRRLCQRADTFCLWDTSEDRAIARTGLPL